MGVLGTDDTVWNEAAGSKLLQQAEADLPPNRVALFVCPECGGISCGAVTVALNFDGEYVIWSDFRWERDWDGAPDDRSLAIGPFVFDRREYESKIRDAICRS